jgi:hypothetical protein
MGGSLHQGTAALPFEVNHGASDRMPDQRWTADEVDFDLDATSFRDAKNIAGVPVCRVLHGHKAIDVHIFDLERFGEVFDCGMHAQAPYILVVLGDASKACVITCASANVLNSTHGRERGYRTVKPGSMANPRQSLSQGSLNRPAGIREHDQASDNPSLRAVIADEIEIDEAGEPYRSVADFHHDIIAPFHRYRIGLGGGAALFASAHQISNPLQSSSGSGRPVLLLHSPGAVPAAYSREALG